jgi:two-component system, OmpR family, response regulator
MSTRPASRLPRRDNCAGRATLASRSFRRTASELRRCGLGSQSLAVTDGRLPLDAQTAGPMRLLVVDDAPKMSALLQRAFREDGYAVDIEALGSEAVWRATETEFDAVILDVGLPDITGFEVCRELRGRGRWMPILMLTARDAVHDLVQGLDCGADDYLTKPFELDELRARLRALVRRAPVPRPATLTVGDLLLDPATRSVKRGEAIISLSRTEFSILQVLMRHAGQVLSRTQILEHAWDSSRESDSNIVDVYVRMLRDKIDRPFSLTTIQTVRGSGYMLRQ